MDYNKERRWFSPQKRAASYAEERKAKVHQHGSKEGKPLTDYESGLRSGYLQCQSDHAGLFRYKLAMDKFGDKDYAVKFSREKGTKLKEGKTDGKKKAN
ncbi:MAG: hypothetical protein K2L70_00065 [Clostridia bacterium]|nr:hypothetical protein [Clostridia bacterium]